MSVLYQLVSGSDTWAASRAQYALNVNEAVTNKTMTSSEAKEILEDLISTENLESAAASVQAKALLVEGVKELISVYA